MKKKLCEDFLETGYLKEEYKCPVEGCQCIFEDKKLLSNHIRKEKQLSHEQYRKNLKQLKMYKESLESDKIGCYMNKCVQCSNCKNCQREEYKIYNQTIKKIKQIQNKQVLTEALEIFDWFYNQPNTKCIEYNIDLSKIKKFLAKNNKEEIYEGLKVYLERGNTNLQYFKNTDIIDGQKYALYKKQSDIEETLPFFIKKYYNSLGYDLTFNLIDRGVKTLQAMQKTFKLTINQLKQVVDFMITKKIKCLSFIDRVIPQVIIKQEKRKSYMDLVLDALVQGNITITDIKSTYDNNFTIQVLEKAKEYLFHESFNPKFLAIEWLFLIQYPLDKESYEFAKQHAYRKTIFSGEQYNKYETWFKQQLQIFEV